MKEEQQGMLKIVLINGEVMLRILSLFRLNIMRTELILIGCMEHTHIY